MHRVIGLGGVLVVVAMAACATPEEKRDPGNNAGGSSAPTHPSGTAYSRIDGASLATMATFSLCKLARHPMFESAGLYRVERLTGVTEEDLWNPGQINGFTYVELSLVDGWHKAEAKPVARILGGPWPDGRVGGWNIQLEVGEVVGLLLLRKAPENRGYPGIHELGLFKRGANGGFSNGQLFTRSAADEGQLGELVTAFSGESIDAPCPANDVQSDVDLARPIEDSEIDSDPIDVQGTNKPDGGVAD